MLIILINREYKKLKAEGKPEGQGLSYMELELTFFCQCWEYHFSQPSPQSPLRAQRKI